MNIDDLTNLRRGVYIKQNLEELAWLVAKVEDLDPHTILEIGGNKRKKDRRITKMVEDKGWAVLRFWEHEIQDRRYEVRRHIMEVMN